MPTTRLAPLLLALAAAQCGLLVLGPVLPDVAASFGVSTAAAGQVRAVSGCAGALAGLATALWGARHGSGRVLRGGLVALIAGAVLSAAAPSLGALAAAQAVVGAAVGVVVAAGLAAASAWAEPERRARTVATVALGQPIAWVAGQPAAGAVGTLGWRWVWLAGPALVAAAALALLRPVADAVAPDTGAPRPRGGLRGWVAGELAASTAWSGLLVFVATILRIRHDVSPATAGLVLGLCSLAYLPAGVWAGRLSSQGRRRAVPALGVACTVLAVALGVAQGPLALSAALFAALVATAAGRQISSSVEGLALASHPLAVMGLRASCTQAGYLAGAAAAGTALALAGPAGVCVTSASAFAVSAAITVADRRRSRPGKNSGRSAVESPRMHTNPEATMPISPITIRPAMPADAPVLRDLAQLDARPALHGPVLLAESRGRPLAAIALDDGAVTADPFRRSDHAVTLLRLQRELVRDRRRSSARDRQRVPRLRLA